MVYEVPAKERGGVGWGRWGGCRRVGRVSRPDSDRSPLAQVCQDQTGPRFVHARPVSWAENGENR